MNSTAPIARSPLTDLHRASRARMITVNQWEVAAEFDVSSAELARARTSIGIADLSHLSKLQCVGSGLAEFCTQAVPTGQGKHSAALQPGRAWVIQPENQSTQLAQNSILCAWLADDQLVAISLDVASADFASSAVFTPTHSLPARRDSEALTPGAPGLRRTHYSRRDVTGHFAVFDVVGPCGEDLLCQLTSIDISTRSFRPGHCAQTGVARVPAILIRPTGTALARIQVWCAREYGHYLGETLLEKAAPIGGGPLGWEAWRATFE